jgi:hypothetical protein
MTRTPHRPMSRPLAMEKMTALSSIQPDMT